VQGDSVSTPMGSYATLHFADGSEVRLGSDNASGALNIASLTYKDRSIATRLRLYLKEGSLWTNAPHLRDASEDGSIMEVETDSAVAAVRGTIFGVQTSVGGNTTISMKDGTVGVYGRTSVGVPEDDDLDVTGNGLPLATLTGGLGNYQLVSVSSQQVISPVTSFTGGSISSEACGGSEHINCGPVLIKATGEWNNLLKSRKPDISTIERTSIGAVVIRVAVPEEDIGRWLCAGNATGDAMEGFMDKTCLKMDASGSRIFSFGSEAASIFTGNSQDSGFAICQNDYSSQTAPNTCSVPRVITVGVEAF